MLYSQQILGTKPFDLYWAQACSLLDCENQKLNNGGDNNGGRKQNGKNEDKIDVIVLIQHPICQVYNPQNLMMTKFHCAYRHRRWQKSNAYKWYGDRITGWWYLHPTPYWCIMRMWYQWCLYPNFGRCFWLYWPGLLVCLWWWQVDCQWGTNSLPWHGFVWKLLMTLLTKMMMNLNLFIPVIKSISLPVLCIVWLELWSCGNLMLRIGLRMWMWNLRFANFGMLQYIRLFLCPLTIGVSTAVYHCMTVRSCMNKNLLMLLLTSIWVEIGPNQSILKNYHQMKNLLIVLPIIKPTFIWY